jgi:hypothetical protein
MNCDVVQRHLLGCESPDRPSAAATAHLAGCVVCREWLQRLLQLERAVPSLPVPSAEAARSDFLRRILTHPTEEGRRTKDKGQKSKDAHRPSIARVVGSWIMDPHSSPRRRVAAGLVAGVAAALLLFLTGWLVWHPGPPSQTSSVAEKPAPDLLAIDLGRLKIDVPEGKKGADRVKAMADAADQLHARCRAAMLTGANNELIKMAQLYGRVVDEGVVKTAEALSLEERREILAPIADNLKNAESEWGRLTQQNGLPADVKAALEKAALAAHIGNARLTELCAV